MGCFVKLWNSMSISQQQSWTWCCVSISGDIHDVLVRIVWGMEYLSSRIFIRVNFLVVLIVKCPYVIEDEGTA